MGVAKFPTVTFTLPLPYRFDEPAQEMEGASSV
jgi:hypothetical protein